MGSCLPLCGQPGLRPHRPAVLTLLGLRATPTANFTPVSVSLLGCHSPRLFFKVKENKTNLNALHKKMSQEYNISALLPWT